ncbi:hypothetical protein [Streptomyces sp. NRRL S-31]|uniref:hypothetical protein n=1 Tax=Streptomyces sp. NRRL S-31 TaxID=1463898 RepID=UPI00131E8A17|nr:hypothetical protein [Streptomyces sp. NRRL S-31]
MEDQHQEHEREQSGGRAARRECAAGGPFDHPPFDHPSPYPERGHGGRARHRPGGAQAAADTPPGVVPGGYGTTGGGRPGAGDPGAVHPPYPGHRPRSADAPDGDDEGPGSRPAP